MKISCGFVLAQRPRQVGAEQAIRVILVEGWVGLQHGQAIAHAAACVFRRVFLARQVAADHDVKAQAERVQVLAKQLRLALPQRR